jgi:hypothetical protein
VIVTPAPLPVDPDTTDPVLGIVTPHRSPHEVLTASLLAEHFLKLKLLCDRQSVGQSVLVSGSHLGPVTDFSFSLKYPLDSCVFVIL